MDTIALGLLMMGWASTPYDPLEAERYARRAVWMALAGPGANLLIVLLAGLGIRWGMWAGVFLPPSTASFTRVTVAAAVGWWQGVALLVSILFTINLTVFPVNLIPLLPLDGSAAAVLFRNERVAAQYRKVMLNPVFAVFGLMWAWRVCDPLFPCSFDAPASPVCRGLLSMPRPVSYKLLHCTRPSA